MEIKGIVKFIGETEQVSDKFKKREFVVTMAGQYPQHIQMQCTQDKVVMLDNLPLYTEVNCHINLRGREWTSPKGEVKYFNTIECWKLEVVGENTTTPPKIVKDDDLPF